MTMMFKHASNGASSLTWFEKLLESRPYPITGPFFARCSAFVVCPGLCVASGEKCFRRPTTYVTNLEEVVAWAEVNCLEVGY